MAGCVVLCLSAGALLIPGGSGASASPRNRAAGPCDKLSSLPRLSTPTTGPSTERSTSVTVKVVAVTQVVLSDSGAPLLARTNTNQSPSCDDVFFVVDSSTGNIVGPASLKVVNEVMVSQFGGPWRPGAWEPAVHVPA